MKKILSNLILLSSICLFLGDHTANAQKAFLEEFNGPDLDPSWLIFDNEGGTHVGFTDEGEYEVVDSQSKSDAGLGLKLSGSGDFTVDATIRLENIFDGRFDFKFRFLAPKFMELVFNQNDFTIFTELIFGGRSYHRSRFSSNGNDAATGLFTNLRILELDVDKTGRGCLTKYIQTLGNHENLRPPQ